VLRLLSGLLLLAPLTVSAQGTGEVRFVETSVDLRGDGTAVVRYTVQWQVLRGEMHGFYFEGNDRLRVSMLSAGSRAVDSRGRQYDLSIREVSRGRWDIILANGAGVSSGTLTYVFAFETDFASAGYVGPTTSAEDVPLVFFNWSPVQWDEARNQEHYTLEVLTPHVLPAGADPRAYVTDSDLVLTEQWVNQRFLIDYQRGEADRLRLVFHREDPGNRADMRTQFYLPAAWFALAPGAAPPRGAPVPGATGPGRWSIPPPLMIGAVLLLGFFVMVVGGKHRSMVAAHRGLDDVRWDNLDWTPPKLVLSTLRVPGKVCEPVAGRRAHPPRPRPTRCVRAVLLRRHYRRWEAVAGRTRAVHESGRREHPPEGVGL
jgi:hypothetical protein